MIVCDKIKLVYIDVPKTGSVTIDTVLKENFGGKLISNESNGQTKHCRVIPNQYREYTRLATVRNPYTRVLSHWFYNTENHNLQRVANKFKYKVDSFDRFLDFLLFINENEVSELQHDICGWFSCSKYLNLCGFDTIIKTEELNEMFNNLWFVEKKIILPVTNTSKNRSFNFTQSQLNKIIKWAEDDFDMFNYRK